MCTHVNKQKLNINVHNKMFGLQGRGYAVIPGPDAGFGLGSQMHKQLL